MAGMRTPARLRETTSDGAGVPHASSCVRQTTTLPTGLAYALRGFTMIEVLITVAIITILISIALPSYSNVMLKLNRTAGQQFMMDIANKEEQTSLDLRGFTATIGNGGLGLTPTSDVAANYTFAVALTGNDCLGSSLSAPGYVITATAVGKQASDGSLCLDSRNNRTPATKWGS
jgi:type IV pilus assembly protein PilE